LIHVGIQNQRKFANDFYNGKYNGVKLGLLSFNLGDNRLLSGVSELEMFDSGDTDGIYEFLTRESD
jgi:hypothetical protein